MAKALGSELIEFYANHFPANCYHEYDIDIFGEEPDGFDPKTIDPAKKYELRDLGWIIPIDQSSSEGRSFSSVFLKWKKTQTHETFLVTVPKELVAKAKADIKALGYSVS